VAKGAFEAGALRELVKEDVTIVRIVAASAGALSGAMIASGVRANTLAATADRLVTLWRDNATWGDSFHLSPLDLISGKGVSDQSKVIELLRSEIQPNTGAGTDINLRVITAPLNGAIGDIDGATATTFEHVLEFTGEDFDDAFALERMFTGVTASAAFPIAFSAVDVTQDGAGPCIDGGMVNNTPVKWALDGDIGQSVDAVFVIAPFTKSYTPGAQKLEGIHLVSHLADMLINERLYRDLREAYQVNAALLALQALIPTIGPGAYNQILSIVGWAGRQVVPIYQIRPTAELSGSAFTGFSSQNLREQYIDLGAAAAKAVLATIDWRAS
jgi:hypothetical protein